MKDQLANNYLLGTDQYLDTLEKALWILETIKSQRGPPLEIKEMYTKGGDWHSYSKAGAWAVAAGDQDRVEKLTAQTEEEQVTPQEV